MKKRNSLALGVLGVALFVMSTSFLSADDGLDSDDFVKAMIENIDQEGVKENLETLYPALSGTLKNRVDKKVRDEKLDFKAKQAGGYEFSSDNPEQQISSELAQLAYDAHEAIKDNNQYQQAWDEHFIRAAQGSKDAIASSSSS